ncbi:hypothetical protein ANN_24380 [Periplaneta americana]|uniref:Uncharacterized protein n=1 Tax=Periplaneta americana TaxID=6978 RepID=A0ABQ8S3B7_PERAM|nr:hypothetical protein ANN_24380 [Periplaneta americana]
MEYGKVQCTILKYSKRNGVKVQQWKWSTSTRKRIFEHEFSLPVTMFEQNRGCSKGYVRTLCDNVMPASKLGDPTLNTCCEYSTGFRQDATNGGIFAVEVVEMLRTNHADDELIAIKFAKYRHETGFVGYKENNTLAAEECNIVCNILKHFH